MGMVGFISSFGILLIPIFLARRRLRSIALDGDRKLVAGVAFTLAVVGLDWVPNGLWAPYPYLLAGALAGVTRELSTQRQRMDEEPMQEYETAPPPEPGPPPHGWPAREMT